MLFPLRIRRFKSVDTVVVSQIFEDGARFRNNHTVIFDNRRLAQRMHFFNAGGASMVFSRGGNAQSQVRQRQLSSSAQDALQTDLNGAPSAWLALL